MTYFKFRSKTNKRVKFRSDIKGYVYVHSETKGYSSLRDHVMWQLPIIPKRCLRRSLVRSWDLLTLTTTFLTSGGKPFKSVSMDGAGPGGSSRPISSSWRGKGRLPAHAKDRATSTAHRSPIATSGLITLPASRYHCVNCSVRPWDWVLRKGEVPPTSHEPIVTAF
jgi:hypothetical protein